MKSKTELKELLQVRINQLCDLANEYLECEWQSCDLYGVDDMRVGVSYFFQLNCGEQIVVDCDYANPMSSLRAVRACELLIKQGGRYDE